MIKFDLFETESSYQCHFAQIGTFVVSISHYMRAYFNYQALEHGRDFSLPSDAGFLNCVALQQDGGDDDDDVGEGDADGGDGEDDNNNNQQQQQQKLYAKIGCMERETFTSTRLQLYVYTDAQCSVPYDDGEESQTHSNKGYTLVNGDTYDTRVSFRPPFYTCQTCRPDAISETFNKKAGTWYDDAYISQYGKKEASNDDQQQQQQQANNNGNNGNGYNDDDDGNAGDDNSANGNQYYADDYSYYRDDGYVDDTYMSANDDISNSYYNQYNYNNNGGNNNNYYQQAQQQYYNYNDDGNRKLLREEVEVVPQAPRLTPAVGELEVSAQNAFQVVC